MTFKPHHDPTHLYFLTATLLGWRPIFAEPAYAHIVLDSLVWHRKHGRWSLFAYVLMPNHLHAIVKPLQDRSISSVLQSFGSYTAHAILARLRDDARDELLAFFARRQDQDASKDHQVWQQIQTKNVYSSAFLREKVEYLHNNPMAKGWHLVQNRAAYPYSSACFYDLDRAPIVEVDDLREWLV